MGFRHARSRFLRPLLTYGRGWRRWARLHAVAPTPTTGSRTCWASTCIASIVSCRRFQHPALGEEIGFGSNRMRMERIEPEHVLAWRSGDGSWVWTFVLAEHDGKTRLLSRNRFRLPTLAARVGMLPMEPCSLVMERKMLRGIKQRAERLAATRPV